MNTLIADRPPAGHQSAQAGPASGSWYASLLRQVQSAGLMRRRRRYYVWKIAVTAILLAAGWTAFALIGDSWWQVAVAVFLAFVFTQAGFIGHDAGHRQIAATRRANDVIGLLHADLAVGLSLGWWIDKHNRHHAHPNQEGMDPDIETGALAFAPSRASRPGAAARWRYRHQAWLFFPLLLLEAISLHIASIRALASRRLRHRRWELVLFAAHAIGYLGVVFLVLSPVKAITFIIVHQGLTGLYLGCAFAPNHKGMTILAADDHTDFLRRQVLTSRNVRGGRLTDFVLGGLNYQIEHHLFPSMPRPNLRHAQPIVREFCAHHDLPYCETSLIDSYAQALRYLNLVGKAVGQADQQAGEAK
jgi:fatty acid desaturase